MKVVNHLSGRLRQGRLQLMGPPQTVQALKSVWSTSRRHAPALLVCWSLLSLGLVVWVRDQQRLRRSASREALQGMADTGERQLAMTLSELGANSEVIATLPALQEVLRQAAPGRAGEERLGGIFSTQIKVYRRYQAIGVFRPDGRVVAFRQAQPARLSLKSLQPVIREGAGLSRGETWLSSVAPAGTSPQRAERFLHLIKPVFLQDGRRAGVLLFSLKIGTVWQQLNRLINRNPSQVRGFVVDASGRILNPPVAPSSLNQSLLVGGLPAVFPREWQNMQPHRAAIQDMDHGLFVSIPVNPPGDNSTLIGSPPPSQRATGPDHWKVVLWSPPEALDRGFDLHDIRFLLVLGLVYGLATSALIALFSRSDDRKGSLQQLRQTLDSLLDPHVLLQPVLNSQGRVVDLIVESGNAAANRLSRRGSRWWRGRSIRRILPQRSVGNLFEQLCRVAETGDPLVLDEVACRPSSGSTAVLLEIRAVLAQPLLSCTWRDVTERQQNRQRIHRSEARLRAVLDTLLDPHVVLAAVRDERGTIQDFRFVEANPLACAFNQLTHDELIGHSLLDLHPASQRTELFDAYIHVVETGEPLILDDWCYPQDLRGGEIRRYDVRAVRLGDGVSQTWRDVTEHYNAVSRLKASEERYRLLAENSVDIILRLDDAGRITWTSPSIRALGYDTSDWMGRDVTELFEGGSLKAWHRQLLTIREGHPLLSRLQLSDRGGGLHWVESQLKEFISSHGVVDGLVLGLRLIDERIETESRLDAEIRKKLFESQQLAAYADEATGVGRWQLDHTTGDLTGSSEFLEVLGLDERNGSLNVAQLIAAIHPQDRDSFQTLLLQTCSLGRPFEERARVAIGTQKERTVVIRGITRLDDSGQPSITTGTVRDITELEALRRELERSEWLDTTTCLPNRSATERQINQVIQEPGEGRTAFIDIDIDNFQQLNDTFGVEHCTRLLCSVAALLRRLLDDGDWLARIGGDEFLVIRHGVNSEEEASDLATRLQKGLVDAPLLGAQHRIGISVSIGVCLWPDHATTAEGLLQCANTALMAAKRRGQRQVQLYSSSISRRIQERVQMGLELWRALETNQLSIVYQPQVNAEGTILGAEALLRWTTLDGVSISPVHFIPLAEETGLIHPIGEWVIDTCFRQLAAWRDSGLPRIPLAINLSAVQLEDPRERLASFVVERMHVYSIDPQMVEFELTETALQHNPDVVSRQFQALAEAGFYLVLDDFGTGYSSLQVLHRLPFRKLKIDRCFVDPLLDCGSGLTIVHASLLMAQRLGLSTLAEGVTQREQVALLSELGCELFQGFLFSRPVATETLEAMLRAGVVHPDASA